MYMISNGVAAGKFSIRNKIAGIYSENAEDEKVDNVDEVAMRHSPL